MISLSDLATKLSSSYNIETIITPLDVQISEAIMNYQENAPNITQHVYNVCGQAITGQNGYRPGLYRAQTNRIIRRAANSAPLAVTSNHNQRLNQHNSDSSLNRPLSGLSLGGHLRASKEGLMKTSLQPEEPLYSSTKVPNSSTLIEEIKSYMLSTRSFWSSLPNSVCINNHALGPAAQRKQPNCFNETFSNSDINFDVRYRVEIKSQVSHLETMRRKIEDALEGVEVEWSNSVSFAGFKPPNYITGRVPPITTTTTTTTTTPEPSDDEPPDDIECGSGDDPTSTDCNPVDSDGENLDGQGEYEPDPTTEDPDPEDTTNGNEESGDMISNNPSSDNSETSTAPDPEDGNKDNALDHQPPVVDDTHQNLITPPYAQQSGQASSKLVIRSASHHLLFASSLVFLWCWCYSTNIYRI